MEASNTGTITTDSTVKPKTALLVGDSICAGYYPYVYDELSVKGVVLERQAVGDSSQLLEFVEKKLNVDDYNLIHFNCGLHDLRVDKTTGNYQQSLQNYKTNFEKTLSVLINQPNTIIVFVGITPVIESRHNQKDIKNYSRYLNDVEKYNETALSVMKRFGVPSYELCRILHENDIEKVICEDGVHMTELGRRLCANVVSGKIHNLLWPSQA